MRCQPGWSNYSGAASSVEPLDPTKPAKPLMTSEEREREKERRDAAYYREQGRREAQRTLLREEEKRMIKEAIKEWLDEKFAILGRWSALGICSLVLAGILLFIIWTNRLGH